MTKPLNKPISYSNKLSVKIIISFCALFIVI